MIKLIKFGAEWCNPCKIQETINAEVLKKFPEVEYQVVDAEKETELAEKYKVQGVPVLVIEKDGETVYTASGLHVEDQLTELLNQFKD